MKKKYFINLLLISSLFSLASCARQISLDVYESTSVGEVSTTYAGVIRNVRIITVDDSEQLGDNQAGIVGGGVAGGLVGNAFGRGNLLPTAAGAIAGAVGGALIEKKIKRQSAFEYIIQLENGNLMTVVQGGDNAFVIDQPIYVIVSQMGRSRIIAQ